MTAASKIYHNDTMHVDATHDSSLVLERLSANAATVVSHSSLKWRRRRCGYQRFPCQILIKWVVNMIF